MVREAPNLVDGCKFNIVYCRRQGRYGRRSVTIEGRFDVGEHWVYESLPVRCFVPLDHFFPRLRQMLRGVVIDPNFHFVDQNTGEDRIVRRRMLVLPVAVVMDDI